MALNPLSISVFDFLSLSYDSHSTRDRLTMILYRDDTDDDDDDEE